MHLHWDYNFDLLASEAGHSHIYVLAGPYMLIATYLEFCR
jgi:hypothetical protein